MKHSELEMLSELKRTNVGKPQISRTQEICVYAYEWVNRPISILQIPYKSIL